MAAQREHAVVQREYAVTVRPLMPPQHPGGILREDVLPALGISVVEAARRMGVARQTLHRIMAETHPITVAMALRLGKFCGNGPSIWLRMQQAYDLWHAERVMRDELDCISVLARKDKESDSAFYREFHSALSKTNEVKARSNDLAAGEVENKSYQQQKKADSEDFNKLMEAKLGFQKIFQNINSKKS